MLINLNILVIGGDDRNLEVIHNLAIAGANVYLLGFDQLTFDNPKIHQSRLNEVDLTVIDAITLPVAGTDETGKVEATYSNKTIILSEELISQTPAHCIIYTGTSQPFLDTLTTLTQRKLVRLFDRDDVAILNSIPTAEGALKLAMEQTDRTIHGSKVMVLGFGRVGTTVARLFSSVGANVRVGVRKSVNMARITEMGLTPIRLADLEKEISDIDICINTIPHQILDSNIIATMSTSTLIIDLASKPGGTDFKFADNKGLNAIHALGLPGKTAPKTAGIILADILSEELSGIEFKK
ncbi:dipicolinate synthase subunit DpsA [Virgibacillus byunsanensis]|uniref:Dipicolinate synthase subunit DpsA n=1 Tax=Virgibacillus byunsanensis TaxID=570945 RepID=A0ABW3LML3_9BACI